MSLKTGNLLQISGWAPRVASFRHTERASRQAERASGRHGSGPCCCLPTLPTLSAVLEYADPQGWQWYNEPQDDEDTLQASPQTPAPRSATELKNSCNGPPKRPRTGLYCLARPIILPNTCVGKTFGQTAQGIYPKRQASHAQIPRTRLQPAL